MYRYIFFIILFNSYIYALDDSSILFDEVGSQEILGSVVSTKNNKLKYKDDLSDKEFLDLSNFMEKNIKEFEKRVDREIEFAFNNSVYNNYTKTINGLEVKFKKWKIDIINTIMSKISQNISPKEYDTIKNMLELNMNKILDIGVRERYKRVTIKSVDRLKNRLKNQKKSTPKLKNLSKKYAFIVGNSSYFNNQALKNPTNDAKALAKLLKKLSFNVELGVDLDLVSFRNRFEKFLSNINREDSVIFFYAGHGVQYQGKNFLLPIGYTNSIKKLSDFSTKAISLNYILTKLNEKSMLKFIILDACRTSPFTQFNLKRGLARGVKLDIDSNDKIEDTYNRFLAGTLIAYSTSPDKNADDGNGIHSPYIKYLLKNIKLSNFTIENILKKTRADVVEETSGFQTPWYESSINGNFYPAGTNSMEFMDILNLYALDRDETIAKWYKNDNRYLPIKWETKGIFKEKEDNIYSRIGKLSIKNGGEYSHIIISDTISPVKWKIKLLGFRSGYTQIKLSNHIFVSIDDKYTGKLYINPKYIEDNRTICKNDIFATNFSIINAYRVELPDKKPLNILERKYCRGVVSNCNYEYKIYIQENMGSEPWLDKCRQDIEDAKELYNEIPTSYRNIHKSANNLMIKDNYNPNQHIQIIHAPNTYTEGDGREVEIFDDNGNICRLFVTVPKTILSHNCIKSKNLKGIDIFCTKDKNICKTLDEIWNFTVEND